MFRILGDGGESSVAEHQAGAAAQPPTPQPQAPGASIDAAAALVREHTERLAEQGILQVGGCGPQWRLHSAVCRLHVLLTSLPS